MARITLHVPPKAARGEFIVVNGLRETASKASPIRLTLDGGLGAGRLVLADHANIWRKHQCDEERRFFDRLHATLASKPDRCEAFEAGTEPLPALAVRGSAMRATTATKESRAQRSSREARPQEPILHYGEPLPMQEPEHVIGVDVGAPSSVAKQRTKLVALVAVRTGLNRYVARLQDQTDQFQREPRSPGFTFPELRDWLLSQSSCLIAMDFPFALPKSQTKDSRFWRFVGEESPCGTWAKYIEYVAGKITFDDRNMNLRALEGWRSGTKSRDGYPFWVNRHCEGQVQGAAPLKVVSPCLFNMTLAGAWLLYHLKKGGFDVDPLVTNPTPRRLIEIYPSGSARALGLTEHKRSPEKAVGLMQRALGNHGIDLDVDAALLQRVLEYRSSGNDPDLVDAFLGLGTAMLYLGGKAVKSGDDNAREAEPDEGAIWIPKPTPAC